MEYSHDKLLKNNVAKKKVANRVVLLFFIQGGTLREDYLKQAQKVITDQNILINVVSRRVKQLKFGSKPTVESLEKLSLEDIALLEIIRGNITYELYDTSKRGEGALDE